MSIGRYYGITAGAIVRWHGERVAELTIGAVDRSKPEGADWTLRFTPTGSLTGADRRGLARRLHALSVDCRRDAWPLTEFLAAIDTAIAVAAIKAAAGRA